MKYLFNFLSILIVIFSAKVANAQWSVINTDKVPKQTAYKYQPFTQAEWDSSNYAHKKALKWFTDVRYDYADDDKIKQPC